MSGKLDFTRFLNTLPDTGATGGQVANKSSNPAPSISTGQLIARILRDMRDGKTTLKDLVQPGESFGEIFDAIVQLQSLGYVEKGSQDVFRLTDDGYAVARQM
jgi:hypothetical protein